MNDELLIRKERNVQNIVGWVLHLKAIESNWYMTLIQKLLLQENGHCSKGDGCKFGHAMLGLELNRADFDFTRDANHHMNTEQISRMCGLCIDFVRVRN